jgi:DNA uptake protein ComE-like DNA-binding protein
MIRRTSLVGAIVLAVAVMWSVAAGAQIKTMNAPKIVDINSAPEADIVAVGIDKTAAKKIVEGRPYRNKRDLLTRQLLTRDQYEKVKDLLVAKQMARK